MTLTKITSATNSNIAQEYIKCILPIIHGSSAEQLACQVHKSQIASTHPSQLRHTVSHPPTIWEGSPNRMGAKAGGDNLTKMSPETTTSLRADSDTK